MATASAKREWFACRPYPMCASGGRLATGWLLDRLPTRPVAVAAFMLPVAITMLFLIAFTFRIPRAEPAA